MHWRSQFPPQQSSVLTELLSVFRASFRSEMVMATELPDELPPAPEASPLPAGPARAAG